MVTLLVEQINKKLSKGIQEYLVQHQNKARKNSIVYSKKVVHLNECLKSRTQNIKHNYFF